MKTEGAAAIRREMDVRIALARLRDAYHGLANAGCKKSAAKTRAAIRSTEGALRNATRFANKASRHD